MVLCADCGKDVTATIHGSCAECFVQRTALLQAPDVVDVEFCAHCEARNIGKHWVDLDEGAPVAWGREDAVRERVVLHQRVQGAMVQFDERAQDDKNFVSHVTLEGDVDGVPVRSELDVLVRQKQGVCDRCSRMMGDFWAAIIQLRATDRGVTDDETERAHRIVGDELDRMRANGNRFAFLTKSGAMHGGWDYYLGDIEAARQVCRILKGRLGATVQESAKLVGRREGDDVYRVTFLVRVDLFANGDYAEVRDGRLVQVHAVNHGRAACTDLIRHEKTRIPEGELKRLGGSEIEQEAVLVSAVGADLQLLDPVTLRTVDVPRPPGYSAEAGPDGAVRVVRFRDRLHLVPVSNKS